MGTAPQLFLIKNTKLIVRKKILTINEILIQLQNKFPRTSFKPQQIAAIFDFYNNWNQFRTGLKENSMNILVGPVFFKKKCPQYGWHYVWKWLCLMVIIVGFVLLFIEWGAGLILLILGWTILVFINLIRERASERFAKELMQRVGNGREFEGLIDLAISYVTGAIYFSSKKGYTTWPQYPSCALTGKIRFIEENALLTLKQK